MSRPEPTLEDDPDGQMSLLLGRAYFSYLGMLGRYLKLKGLDDKLKPGIGNILFALFREDDQRPVDIANELGLARSTLTKLIGQVKNLGLIDTRPDPDDGRSIRLSLTADARALMPECFELANHLESIICRGFSDEERNQFGNLLLRATANIREEQEHLETAANEKTKPKPKS
ncbi:MAG: MarR family winged helix-turn-helix transcriptional regulator [Verrucomicrobiales bacterium]|nr:MarR family winged helix-turn-helix transcriptional regulator [Verrucomicrobiales bacterium]